MTNDNLQTEFNRITQRGIVFGIIWIMGIGSVIAVLSGLQAKRLLRESNNSLEGSKKAYLSIWIGIFGLMVLAATVVFVMAYRKV